MNFKSIRMRTLAYILPFVLGIMVLLSFLSYSYSKNLINQEIEEKMNYNMFQVIEAIDKILIQHSRIPESLARLVEASGNQLTKEQYIEILKKTISINQDTFGAGIWFEPYRYSENVQYFGPYVYKDGSSAVVTLDYETPEYNYPSWDWYKMGMNISQSVVWSAPYYDETTNVTMITTSAPFYDSNGKFIGLTTGDVDLVNLQNLISEIKVGEKGEAFLLSKDGTYIAHPNAELVMKKKITESENTSLATLGAEILEKKGGQAAYTDNDGSVRIYYTSFDETGWILGLSIPENELFGPLKSLMTKLLLIICASLLIVVLIVFLYSQYITNSIRKVNDFSKTIAQGDLSSSLDSKSKDELGQMSNHLNTMTASMRTMIKDVMHNIDQLVETSQSLATGAEQTQKANEQIAETMQSLALGKDEEQKITDNTAKTAEEIAKGIEHIANNIQTVADTTVETSRLAQNGNQVVDLAISQMEKIHKNVLTSGNVVNQLGEKSNQIGEIVSLITSISDQTNLLALNAAIEAARAGEHGKGFAVVADEVRKLAEQSGKAAGNITSLIQEIQKDIGSAIATMQEGTQSVEQGITMVDDAGTSFHSILDAINSISGQMQDIAAVIEEIAAETETMVGSMEHITSLSQQSLENIESTAAASEEQTALGREISDAALTLSQMSESLMQQVNKFKL
ncbi:MAG: methyl-accepting chemotaxis protein [Bacillota bacterium]